MANLMDTILDSVENALDQTEMALKKNRREWRASREKIGFVFHSFKVEGYSECGKDFPPDTEYTFLTGSGCSLVCEKCLSIRSGE